MSQELIDLTKNIIYALEHNKSLREKFLKTLLDTEEHKEQCSCCIDPMFMTKPNGSL